MTTSADTLTARWRAEAVYNRARANELGDCRAGLEIFTEATVLETCAVEAETARDRVIAILRHQLCETVHLAHGEAARYRREHRFAEAYATGRALEVVLGELGRPEDRTLPQPDGTLPLNPSAEAEARSFLGTPAGHILGKAPVA